MNGLYAIKQHVLRQLVRRTDADLLEVDQFGQVAATARADDGIGADWTDAGYAQELFAFRRHDFNWLMQQVFISPGLFWIDIVAQVAVAQEGQFFDVPFVVAQQKAGLIQAKFADRLRGWQVSNGVPGTGEKAE